MREITPSPFARHLAAQTTGKDPRIIEVILRQTARIVKMERGHLIVETGPGWVCAHAGVDESNSLGPDTVIDGQVIGSSRVAGRINMLAVHPDGQRVYAASANGGVWHSADGGAHWRSLGGLAATPSPGSINRPAQRNACGAIVVDWNAAGGEVIYVGTGETTHGHDAQPGHSLGGIGILRAVAPAAAASTSGRWTPKQIFGMTGDGHAIYPGVREFEIWGLLDATGTNQLQNFFSTISTTGTAVVELPKYAAPGWIFYAYSGCLVREPEFGDYFNEAYY